MTSEPSPAAEPGPAPEPGAPSSDPRAGGETTRAGFVTLLGYPNAGKSTLLNELVGERLSIVTPRPQTTWWRVAGIRTEERSQMIFLDTPGLLEGESLIDRALMGEAMRGLEDADVVVLVLDAERELGGERADALQRLLASTRVPLVPVANKRDAVSAERATTLIRRIEQVLTGPYRRPARAVSALTGDGVPELLDELRGLIPPSPFFYPPDEVASAPVRFFIQEMVRETVFERYREEIPYSVFCRVGEFREEAERTYIQVDIFVERRSQKGILIGKGGDAIRALGTEARAKAEHFVGGPVYLDLWVKVLPRWRKKRGELRRMGLPVPES